MEVFLVYVIVYVSVIIAKSLDSFTMASYTVEQNVQMITIYYENECSLVKTLCPLAQFMADAVGPQNCLSTIWCPNSRSVVLPHSTKPTPPVCRRNSRSAENIAVVRGSVQEDPMQSIPDRAQKLGLSQTSTWLILHWDLDLHPYKIQLTPNLKVNNYKQRCVFAERVFECLAENPDFGRKVIFSDKVHSSINCYVNK